MHICRCMRRWTRDCHRCPAPMPTWTPCRRKSSLGALWRRVCETEHLSTGMHLPSEIEPVGSCKPYRAAGHAHSEATQCNPAEREENIGARQHVPCKALHAPTTHDHVLQASAASGPHVCGRRVRLLQDVCRGATVRARAHPVGELPITPSNSRTNFLALS